MSVRCWPNRFLSVLATAVAVAIAGVGAQPVRADVGDAAACVVAPAQYTQDYYTTVFGQAFCWGRIAGQVIAVRSAQPVGANAIVVQEGGVYGDLCGEMWLDGRLTVNFAGLAGGWSSVSFGTELHTSSGAGTVNIGGRTENPDGPAVSLDPEYRGHGLVSFPQAALGSCLPGTVGAMAFVVGSGLTALDALPTPREMLEMVQQPDKILDRVNDEIDSLLPPAAGTPSAQCTSPTVSVIDTPVAGGYLRMLVQQNTASTWVCVRGEAAGSGFGGRLVLDGPVPTAPTADSSSGACSSTPGNTAPGPHPVAGPGTVAGQPFLLDTWASSGETWVCVQLGTERHRVRLSSPGLSSRFERDP